MKTLNDYLVDAAKMFFPPIGPFDRTTQSERQLIWAVDEWLQDCSRVYCRQPATAIDLDTLGDLG